MKNLIANTLMKKYFINYKVELIIYKKNIQSNEINISLVFNLFNDRLILIMFIHINNNINFIFLLGNFMYELSG